MAEDAQIIMGESVTCYKIGAYRSAYLMSYLAFKQTIRKRILKSPTYPECYNNETEWDRNVLSVLRDDDKWEFFINEIILGNKDKSNNKDKAGAKLKEIFLYKNREISVLKYNYWKEIRNSCAHAKDERITSATVEQFWNYIQDNLSEFYVLGGKKYLLSELINCYTYYVSDNKKDISSLLMDIKTVYKQELKQFFFDFLNQLIAGNRKLINDANYEFFGKIIFSEEDDIKDAFISSICNKKEVFLDFYKYYPTVLNLTAGIDSRFIQDYINPLLCREICYMNVYKNCFWGILINSLGIQAQSLNINEITSNYENLKMIELEIDEYQQVLLNEHNVFKSFIFGAGRDLFNNDARSHWEYYDWSNTKDDTYVIKCFDYVKWDSELLCKINYEIGYLLENIKSRSRPESKGNGTKRVNTYKTIISNSRGKIQKFCADHNINLEDYPNINELITLD
ncbi:hypothetical protein M3231_25020 [Neobacillus mesonae]|nr:hypothetical protein [Neobacillus mesonae]